MDADRLVVIDFMAEWAPPCKQMNERMEELTKRVKDYCIVKRICADDSPDIHMHFEIVDLPTFIFFKKGEQINKIIGPDWTNLQKEIERENNPVEKANDSAIDNERAKTLAVTRLLKL